MKEGQALTTLLLIKCELYAISDWILDNSHISNQISDDSSIYYGLIMH